VKKRINFEKIDTLTEKSRGVVSHMAWWLPLLSTPVTVPNLLRSCYLSFKLVDFQMLWNILCQKYIIEKSN